MGAFLGGGRAQPLQRVYQCLMGAKQVFPPVLVAGEGGDGPALHPAGPEPVSQGNRNAWKSGARSGEALETARLIKRLGGLLSGE